MGAPFRDITLYNPTTHKVGTPEYWEETSLFNFVSDLYMTKMYGYKPPKTTRITIEPFYHKIWNRTWKNGSLVSIAPYFDYEKYITLDHQRKYLCILDLIQVSVLQLSDEYNWDKGVFENAYKEVIKSDFIFKLECPVKMSRDGQKRANISIVKTDTKTTINVYFNLKGKVSTIKLLEKRNWWWYDSAYIMAKFCKWFDNDKFGIEYKPANLKIWYSLSSSSISTEIDGTKQENFDITTVFQF